MFDPEVHAVVRRVYVDPQADTQPGGLSEAKYLHVSEAELGLKEDVVQLKKEVDKLKHLKHDNILRYMGTTWQVPDPILNIFLENFPRKTIASLLEDQGPLSEPVIIKYSRQILLGLEYLHKNKLEHKRVRGETILVDDNGNIKLADFGIPTLPEDLIMRAGFWTWRDTYWMAPEEVHAETLFLSDIWSFGCTVIEMALGKPPWSDKYKNQLLYLNYVCACHDTKSCAPPDIPEHLSQEAKEFLGKCLQADPMLRSSASQLLEEPFLTSQCEETSSGLHTPGTSGKGVKNFMVATRQSASEDHGEARLKIRAAFNDKTQEVMKVNSGISYANEE